MNEMDGQSRDNVRARIEELKKPFPEAVSEGRLDYDMLMALLGDDFDNDSEKYQFTWKGKLDSLRLAQKRSAATLRPCQGESLNWETTKNLYIEGDNLEVLKLLQQGYLRKVKLIYIDPSYNTGNDFAYEDDFSDPIKQYCAQTGRVLRANPETAGRYHSKWLSMMYPRLKIAKTLLRDDGVIFISIDDNEQHNLRKLCDEVFGEENFVANILWQKRYSPANDHLTICPMHDFILVYRKSDAWQRNLLARTEENDKQYRYEDERGVFRPDNDKCNKTAAERPNLYYPIIHPVTGEEVWPSKDAVWRYSIERHEENVRQNMVFWGKDGTAKVPSFKRYRDMLRNGGGTVPSTWWAFEFAGHNDETAKETSELIGSRVFSTPKPVKLLKQILALGSSDGDLVLDFFSGSAAMAQAVMEMNASSDAETDSRRFILVQIPEKCEEDSEAYRNGFHTIADIGKERIRRAGAKIRQDAGLLADGLDTGFRVFKLDSSNLKEWDDTWVPEDRQIEILDRFEEMLKPIKEDLRAVDVVYEVYLKYGIELTEPLAQVEIEGKTFYVVGENGYLFISIDKDLTEAIVEQAAAQYAPGTMIFARDSFADSNEIANVQYILEKHDIEFR